MKQPFVTLLLLFLGLGSASFVSGQTETGIASFYHDKFIGRKTANGEIFSQEKLTAAHKTLPLGTWVKVTNLSNDSSVIVRINDRMPLWNKRSIDLSEAAARQLNYINKGLTKVLIEIIPNPFQGPTALQPRDLPVDYLPVAGVQQIAENTPQFALKPPPVMFDMEAYAENIVLKPVRR